ncbi:MAG: HAD family hydrolase, partial [Actinobacteria bacterium]|nr:HAD family hydrolase [Actinomycetota bacterium]
MKPGADRADLGAVPFEAVLFDAGGVLVVPDPSVLAPTLAYYGASGDHTLHIRAHYAAMAAKSRAGARESDWSHYDAQYVRTVGVPDSEVAAAARVLAATRHAHLWRHPVPGAREALGILADAGIPIGVVSNASGQIAEILWRSGICQVGGGPFTPVRCIVDSHVVGVAKPDPRIFDHALAHFGGIDRARILYVG